MKKSKKISWIDGSEKPTGEYVTTNQQFPAVLLVLTKGFPQPRLAIYVSTTAQSKEKQPLTKFEYWHVLHTVTDADLKIVAWRPAPKIPSEYYKVTGYDKYLEARESPKSRKG